MIVKAATYVSAVAAAITLVIAAPALADPPQDHRAQVPTTGTLPDGYQPELRSGALLHPDNDRAQIVVRSAEDTVSSRGFDWLDAAIGAGAGIALALLAGGGVAMAIRRRGPRLAHS